VASVSPNYRPFQTGLARRRFFDTTQSSTGVKPPILSRGSNASAAEGGATNAGASSPSPNYRPFQTPAIRGRFFETKQAAAVFAPAG
jgi:hypothetical protein